MRLIDAEKLDVFSSTCPKGMDMNSFMAGVGAVLDMVYDASTVEETIRCEDCKHFTELHDNNGTCDKRHWGNDFHAVKGIISGDWYCADGERKMEC